MFYSQLLVLPLKGMGITEQNLVNGMEVGSWIREQKGNGMNQVNGILSPRCFSIVRFVGRVLSRVFSSVMVSSLFWL